MSPYRFYTNNSIVAFSSCHSQIAYINRFNSSTSLNTVVEDTASDGDVFPNSARIFLALNMASDEQL